MTDSGKPHRNPFLDKATKTRNLTGSHRRSKVQEASLAKTLGGRLTAASGAKDVKGDVRIKKVVRLEAKTTMNKSFSVTREMINKIETAAVSTGEMPVLVVEFHDGLGKKLQSLAIMPMYALETLIEGQEK